MPSIHAKIFHLSGNGFKALIEHLKEMPYSPRRREGFELREVTPTRLEGRYFFTKVQKTTSTDPQSLEPVVSEQPLMLTCTFRINFRAGVLCCEERRGDLKILEDLFNGLEGVECECEDFSSDVIEIYGALRDALGKLDLRTLRIKDYLGREGLLTSANFKLMEPGNEADILRKYRGQCQGFAVSFMSEEGPQRISVARKGSIRSSEGVTEDIIEMLIGLLRQHHEAVEAAVVEV